MLGDRHALEVRRGWIVVVAVATLAVPPAVRADDPSPITHVEQPTGIDLADYARAWPSLEPLIVRLRAGERRPVKADLERLLGGGTASDGALNLLAQMEREDGRLDEAESAVAKAVDANPKQSLHRFQQAMVYFARLSQAGGLNRWRWHRKTRGAYQKAFDLDPRPVPYRYYLAYSLLQMPGIVGGDKDKALEMVERGIALGHVEFYVVRADVHRQRGEIASAFADYDKAIAVRTFKLNSFLAAGQLALEKKDMSRAKRFLEWAVSCRPDSGRTHEGLGDYHAAAGDAGSAAQEYEAALRADPGHAAAREKLARLRWNQDDSSRRSQDY